MDTQTDTEIVHIGRKSQNECTVMVNAGKRSFKALWDSGAGRYVISYECYNKISPKFKSDLFTSEIRLKAANGTFIRNKGECEISFKIGQRNIQIPIPVFRSIISGTDFRPQLCTNFSHWYILECQ